jgi:hypothetical protein
VSGWEPDEAEDVVEGAAVVIVEALAAGPSGVLASAGTSGLARAAREASVPVWAVAGVGRLLHDDLLGEMLRRAGDTVELIGEGSFEVVIGPTGPENPAACLSRPLCPLAPELLVRAG